MPSDDHDASPTTDASAVPVVPAPARLLALTARIVAAHAERNPVSAAALPELIRSVHRALGGMGQGGATAASGEPARPEPAVPVKRSVARDRITCLECGARLTMLKRHLSAEHGLTPGAYRARWGLPRDYPMTAPDYAAVRSGMAKQAGFGRKRGLDVAETAAVPQPEEGAPPSPGAAEAPETDEASDAPGAALPEAAEIASPSRGRGRKRQARPAPEAPADAQDAVPPSVKGPDEPAPARRSGRRRSKDASAG